MLTAEIDTTAFVNFARPLTEISGKVNIAVSEEGMVGVIRNDEDTVMARSEILPDGFEYIDSSEDNTTFTIDNRILQYHIDNTSPEGDTMTLKYRHNGDEQTIALENQYYTNKQINPAELKPIPDLGQPDVVTYTSKTELESAVNWLDKTGNVVDVTYNQPETVQSDELILTDVSKRVETGAGTPNLDRDSLPGTTEYRIPVREQNEIHQDILTSIRTNDLKKLVNAIPNTTNLAIALSHQSPTIFEYIISKNIPTTNGSDEEANTPEDSSQPHTHDEEHSHDHDHSHNHDHSHDHDHDHMKDHTHKSDVETVEVVKTRIITTNVTLQNENNAKGQNNKNKK